MESIGRKLSRPFQIGVKNTLSAVFTVNPIFEPGTPKTEIPILARVIPKPALQDLYRTRPRYFREDCEIMTGFTQGGSQNPQRDGTRAKNLIRKTAEKYPSNNYHLIIIGNKIFVSTEPLRSFLCQYY